MATGRSTHPVSGRERLVQVTMRLLLGLYLAGMIACTPASYYGHQRASTGVTTVEDLIARDGSGIRSSPGFPMSAYTDSSGVFHATSGYIRLLESDSLELVLHGKRVFERVTADSIVPGGFLPDTSRVVPRGTVVTVFYDRADVAGAVLEGLGAVAGVLEPPRRCGG